jgi:hypothetical protein
MKKKRRTYDSIKNLFSSFAVTVGAVIIAVTVIPKSPKATIENLNIFENQVVYQVEVTDEDHALDLKSLKIVLDNQFETYEYPLNLGKNVGLFEDLNPGTTYQLSVFGSKGFGSERLAAKKITTQQSPGGAIVSYDIVDSTEYDYTYQVRVITHGLFDTFEEVTLYYAYAFPDEPMENYKSVEILSPDQMIILEQIPNAHTTVDLYLEATTYEFDTVILDQLNFLVPFDIEAYIYLSSYTKSSITYSFYPDNYVDDASYMAYIYKDGALIESFKVQMDDEEMHYSGTTIKFTKLKANTLYHIHIKATYQNPITLRRESKIIYDEEMRTLGDYNITFDITEFEAFYEFRVEVFDPNHLFQVPYYTIYDESSDFPIYIAGMDMQFTPLNDTKYVIFTIDKSVLQTYQLKIGIRNQNDQTINHIIYYDMLNN